MKKLNLDKRYTKICKYIIATAIIIYFLFNVIDAIPSFYDNMLNFLYAIYDISYPIILGLIIAYLLYGPMSGVEHFLMKRKHFPHNKTLCRSIGLAVSYLALLGIVAFILIGIYFMIGGHLSQSSTVTTIINTVTDYISNNSLSTDAIEQLIEEKNIPFGDVIISQFDNIAAYAQRFAVSFVDGVASFIISLGSNIFTLAISLILSIYLLFSHEYFRELWNRFFYIIFRKTKSGKVIKRSLHIINYTFSKYIRGQLIEASIVGVLSALILYIIGVDYALVIGIIAGVCNLVPYIGPFVGIVLAGIISLFSGSIWMCIASIIGLFILQQIDANILCPKIVGDIVGMHPAFILIAITIGGNWAGLFGMLIAVPVGASLKTILSDWFDYYIKDNYTKYTEETKEDNLEKNQIVSAFDLNEKAYEHKNSTDDSKENEETKCED